MAPGCVNILMHYGGAFADQDPLTYDGGEVQLFRNIDKDVMSYFHVLELAKSVGFKDGDNMFYGVPGRSLEASIDLLKDDTSVCEMLKFANQTDFLEIYIQHKEHGRGGKQTVGNTVQDTDNTKFRHHRMRIVIILHVGLLYWVLFIRKQRLRLIREPCRCDSSSRTKNMNDMIYENDIYCVQQLRMDRRCFWNLCSLVRDIGGLRDTRNVKVEEMVTMFLHVLAYDGKSRSMRINYQRSQETISRHFNNVLGAVLKLWSVLLKSPQPITDDYKEKRWKWFKPLTNQDIGSRKNDIATNVLGACTPDMQFTYVLAGWEGSAADARVLRDALSRPNGLRVPRGCYYLVDAGYKNCEGFLAPFRGQRLPNAQIKADPHIMSKVKTMKKLLSYILDIQQNGSGFGWDDDRKMVVGDKEQFGGWAKSRPGAAALYIKLFPSHHNNASNGSKCTSDRKRVYVEDDALALDFSSVAKSLKTLVEAEIENASAMNAVRAAFVKEFEGRNQTAKRREQLFNMIEKLGEFSQDQIVKATLLRKICVEERSNREPVASQPKQLTG
ncbi:hypothetical protein U9M48_026784 [Paspalum notatum var. saurae]|uniref:Transposase n=1 Tax=Paspalum notatum var. saurae TaxID=547442 RepID=A0AAQ3TXE4_PASNO